MNRRIFAGPGLALAVLLVTSCGGSSPAQPTPQPTVAPTPTPVPTPTPLPLTQIKPCPLPASKPGPPTSCTDPPQRLGAAVTAAIDRATTERHELFDFTNMNGGPRIVDVPAYMTAVVAALGEAGHCARIDAEGEIGVKKTNSFNEQWLIATRVGWGVPTDHWVTHKYKGACSPSVF